MRLPAVLPATLIAFASSVAAYVPASTSQTDALAALGLAKLAATVGHNSSCVPSPQQQQPACNWHNVAKRQEW